MSNEAHITIDDARALVADAVLWPRIRDFIWDFAPQVHTSWLEGLGLEAIDAGRDVGSDASQVSRLMSSPSVKRFVLSSLRVSSCYHSFPKEDHSRILLLDGPTLEAIAKWFKANNTPAVILNHNIDTSFITQLERRNEKYKFMRIDSELISDVKEEITEDELKDSLDEISKAFKKALNKDNLNIKIEKLKDENISSILTLSEEGRRMQDMMKMYGMAGMDPNMFGGDECLTLNFNNKLVQFILEHKKSKRVPIFCEQLYDLALLANRPLTSDEMTRFVKRSNEIMLELAD